MDSPCDDRSDAPVPAMPGEAELLALMEQSDRDLAAGHTAPLEAGRGPFFPAPRPYPSVTRPGWRPGWLWLKEGSYWIAHVLDSGGAVSRRSFTRPPRSTD
jgi:hypothetical protein